MAHHDPQIISWFEPYLRHLANTNAMRRTRHDNGTWLQRRPLAQICHYLWYTEDHIVRQRILHSLAVEYCLQLNVAWVWYRRRRYQAWSHWREAIEALAEPPLRSVKLVDSRGYVIRTCVAQHVIHRIFFTHVLG